MMKPEIEYPCRWEYTAIGPNAELMRVAIAGIMADLQYDLAHSNRSRGGKYCSMLISVEVASESHRNDLFAALREHGDIAMVL